VERSEGGAPDPCTARSSDDKSLSPAKDDEAPVNRESHQGLGVTSAAQAEDARNELSEGECFLVNRFHEVTFGLD
jgi:hypothetical protein